MHHLSLFTLATVLLSTASGYVLPATQPDGIYQVTRDSFGNEVHERMAVHSVARDALADSSSTSLNTHNLAKRAFGRTHCGCGFNLNTGDTDAAVADLKQQLGDKGHFIDPGLSYYSVRGGVVAFVCNDDGNARLRAWTSMVTQAAEQITGSCGRYIAGSTGQWDQFSIGYMRNSAGLDFCGASLGAPSGSC